MCNIPDRIFAFSISWCHSYDGQIKTERVSVGKRVFAPVITYLRTMKAYFHLHRWIMLPTYQTTTSEYCR